MSERYCPECKQNVDVAEDYIFTPCFNCGYAFGVVVDKLELEELVNHLDGCRTEAQQIKAAAKFREKYLEGK